MASRFLFLVALLLPAAGRAQHHGTHGAAHPASADSLTAASLSPDEEAGLLAGEGLGMAAAAERNGYPGPLHVLELADSLGLSPAQRAEAEQLRAAMLAEAVPLGTQIVAAEHALDEVFAQGRASAALVDAITAEIGTLRGRLRAVHLHAHFALRDSLTPEQIAHYGALRGHTRP